MLVSPRNAATLLAACCLALFFAASGHASSRSVEQPELNAVASEIAHQDIEVRCWVDENDPDADPYAWGYVNLLAPVIFLDPRPCAGALSLLHHTMAPLWEQALGALVLTHEAYHLNVMLPYWRRGNEAQTECRAIKHVPATLRELGATPALADSLLPWALTAHYKISSLHSPGEAPAYDYPSCRVPGMEWWPTS